MKRKPCFSLLVASVLCICSVALAQQEKQPMTNCDADKTIKADQLVGLPCKQGYFYKSGTDWIELGHSSISKAKLKDSAKTLLTAGIVAPGIDVVYEGPQARLKVNDPRPTFYVQMPGKSSFIDQCLFKSRTKQVIVQLDQKKSTRQLEIRPTGIFSWRRGSRFKKKDMHETAVTRISSDVIAITPKSDLRPGEYLLTVVAPGRHGAQGDHGYDFTVLP